MRQDNIQSKLENQHFVNLIGIIILPNNPFFIKDQPFYLKKLCGVSILERNIYTLHILIFGIFGQFKFVIFSICIHAIITSITYSIQAISHMKKANNSNISNIT